MTTYEVKLADGSAVTMSGTDAEHACARAADLHGQVAVAWRHPRTWVGPVHPSQIIG